MIVEAGEGIADIASRDDGQVQLPAGQGQLVAAHIGLDGLCVVAAPEGAGRPQLLQRRLHIGRTVGGLLQPGADVQLGLLSAQDLQASQHGAVVGLARLIAGLVGVERDQLQIGQPLQVEFQTFDDQLTLPMFRPVEA